ncbi:MAG: hypothetical protein KY437_02985 [Actinobacteria bacterium]|nr:hypothetical protein [Actinomycetota bacterium]
MTGPATPTTTAAVEYQKGYECPTINQLVGIFGDDPADDDRLCDNALCNLQIEGTGDDPEDVIFEGGFKQDGEWIDRHNGIRADRDASVPGVGGVAVVSASTSALAVEYADAPSVELVTYEHGEDVSYAIELRNDGPLPVTVEDVPISDMVGDLRLIRPTQVLVAPDGTALVDATVDQASPFEPFRLARGASRTVIVTGVFDNCVYYTERAMDLIGSQPVTWSVAGWSATTEVELSSQLVVRSPYLRVCPDRVMDRGARTRTGSGTGAG